MEIFGASAAAQAAILPMTTASRAIRWHMGGKPILALFAGNVIVFVVRFAHS